MANAPGIPPASDAMRLTVSYDGGSVPGRMDARDLAPAMLSTARLFEHTAQELFGTTASVKIDVQADFRGGSFTYEIVTYGAAIVAGVGHQLWSNLSISDVVIAADSLFKLVRLTRGRAVQRVERGPETSNITFHDGDAITVNAQTANLYLNPTIRRDLEGAVAPLKEPGIEQFVLRTPVAEPSVVSKDEVEFFNAPPSPEEVIYDDTTPQIVELRAPDFGPGNKWKFTLAGTGMIWASIIDPVYLDKVRRHVETFGAGDVLRVRLHTVVSRRPDNSLERTDEIVEVLQKIPPANQETLFPAEPPESGPSA